MCVLKTPTPPWVVADFIVLHLFMFLRDDPLGRNKGTFLFCLVFELCDLLNDCFEMDIPGVLEVTMRGVWGGGHCMN